MTQSLFFGTWRLISFESRTADGEVSYPYGRDAIGYITYGDSGYMSVAIMAAHRQQFAAGDILGGTTEEKVHAAETYLSYCGRYEVLTGKVIHRIEVRLFPNWIGGVQERFYTFTDNRLTLSTPPILLNGKLRTSYLIWERA
jgi:hypothetical protein